MTESAQMILDAARRILADRAPSARASGDAEPLWNAFDASGFPLALVPEARGGFGLGWAEAGELFFELGRVAVPAPVVEAMLAARVLSDAGCTPPAGMISLADGVLELTTNPASGHEVTGRLPNVSWGRRARFVVVTCRRGPNNGVALVPIDSTHVSGLGANLAGEERDILNFQSSNCAFAGPSIHARSGIRALGAAARSALIAGAVDSMLALSLDYTNIRVQFGKPLRSFQVVQHALAQLGTLAAATRAASESAFQALAEAEKDPVCPSELLAVASAKVVCSESAGTAAALTHQMFGAIGFTEEHVLHRYTKRLWSWRDEFGSDIFWSGWIGERIAREGGDGLWAAVTRAHIAGQSRGAE